MSTDTQALDMQGLQDILGKIATGGDEAREQLAELCKGLMDSGEMKALLLRGEAAKFQMEASAKLDEADELEHLARLRAALVACEEPRKSATAAVERAEQAVKAAIKTERAAEDKARAAADNHRQAVKAEQKAQKGASPAAQTEALMRARAAADVAARVQAGAEGAKAVRVQAERDAEDARRAFAAAEDAEEKAAAALRNPGRAPQSAYTAGLDGLRRLALGQHLDDTAMAMVRMAVAVLARKTSLDRQYRAEGRRKVEEELREKQTNAFMPPTGHKLRPAVPGVDVIPAVPTTGR